MYIHIHTYVHTHIPTHVHIYIKTSGSESQGQEEAAYMCVFRPTRPLATVSYLHG